MGLLLRKLTISDESAFEEAFTYIDDSAHRFARGRTAGQSFSKYLQFLNRQELGIGLPSCFVPASYLCGFVEGKIVGRISIRHKLNDYLARLGGHIGYVTLPPFRREGYATEMLRQALPVAACLGLDRVLLTCDDDNIGSIKTIETCGGVFEGYCADSTSSVKKRRYWIPIV